MAKGLTMSKSIAKATKSTGSSRSAAVAFQARPEWQSRFSRRAAVGAQSRGPPRTGGTSRRAVGGDRKIWRVSARDPRGIPNTPPVVQVPSLILQPRSTSGSHSTLSKDTPESYTHGASRDIKHKDRCHSGPHSTPASEGGQADAKGWGEGACVYSYGLKQSL